MRPLQRLEVIALRNGADRVGDPREAIAAILAEMDRAIGIAEEQAIAARPRRDAPG